MEKKKTSNQSEELMAYCAEKNIRMSEWLEIREDSVYTVRYLFNTISHKFKIDPAYGEKWVENHPEVIASLVGSAIKEIATKLK